MASQDVVSVTPEDTVLRARRRQLDSERREPGWRFLAARTPGK